VRELWTDLESVAAIAAAKKLVAMTTEETR
jgi:hypothetical protein